MRLMNIRNSENLIPKGNLKIISNAMNLILNDNGHEYSDIILNSDNIEILDMLTDTYSRIGDVEKLFEDNLKS